MRGRVLPATLQDVRLVADKALSEIALRVRVEGESNIPEFPGRVRRLWLEPNNPPAYPPVIQALLSADLIIVAPGSLYTSILPNILVGDLLGGDPMDAARDADLVTTDVWTSMGFEAENEERMRDFADWQVDSDMMRVAAKDAVFMHCLPAHRGEEVSAEVIDGPQSVVWDEAENRLHVQKALMEYLLLGKLDQ